MNAPVTIEPQSPAPVSPIERIAELLSRGVTLEQLEKFMELQTRHDQEQARRAYVRAMAQFKLEPLPVIQKKKRVRFALKTGGEVNYKHETLDQAVEAAVPLLAKHGFSHSWAVRQADGFIYVACVMTHQDGHSERVEMFGSPDDSGHKNPLQQTRSTITFLQRATLLLITGLAAKAEGQADDDGGRPAAEPAQPNRDTATAKQVSLIVRRLVAGNIPVARFCQEHGIAKPEELKFEAVNSALEWITTTAQQQEQKA